MKKILEGVAEAGFQAGGKRVKAADELAAPAVGVHQPALAFKSHDLAQNLICGNRMVAGGAGIAAQDEPRPAFRPGWHASFDPDEAVGGYFFSAAAEHDVADRKIGRSNRRNNQGLVFPDGGMHASSGCAETNRMTVLQAFSDQRSEHHWIGKR